MIFLKWILKLSEQYSDIQIIPNSKENYISFSKKVIVDEYEQRNNFSRCKNCKKSYIDKIVVKCPECENDKMIIKRKGEIQKVTMEFRFIDTFKFISTTLDKAVKKFIRS